MAGYVELLHGDHVTSLQPIARDARIALVTASLSVTGAFIGAICAASSVAIIAVISSGLPALVSGGTPGLLAVAAGAGAFVGIIGAPMLGWGLLREVPLGRVILVTALGTIGGAVVGEWARFLNPYAAIIPSVIAGAITGFLLSGIGLRILARRK